MTQSLAWSLDALITGQCFAADVSVALLSNMESAARPPTTSMSGPNPIPGADCRGPVLCCGPDSIRTIAAPGNITHEFVDGVSITSAERRGSVLSVRSQVS
jgi:hypothetical protein